MRLVRINVKVKLNCVLKEVGRSERGMGLRSAVIVSLIAPTNWMNEHGEAMGLRYQALRYSYTGGRGNNDTKDSKREQCVSGKHY